MISFMLRHLTSHLLKISALTLLLSTAALAAPAPASTPSVSWITLARQVGLNEASHHTALDKLRKIKGLDKQMIQALETPQRPLALDVIVALKMDHLLPELLERVNSDEDGFLVLAVNSFLTAKHQDKILSAYIDNLTSDRERLQSAAAVVAMLEPLGRAGKALPKKTLSTLLEHEFPEVRSSALYYARQLMSTGKNKEYLAPALKTLSSTPYQLRIQALFLVEELASREETRSWINFNDISAICEKETNTSVKPWCAKVVADRTPKAEL